VREELRELFYTEAHDMLFCGPSKELRLKIKLSEVYDRERDDLQSSLPTIHPEDRGDGMSTEAACLDRDAEVRPGKRGGGEIEGQAENCAALL